MISNFDQESNLRISVLYKKSSQYVLEFHILRFTWTHISKIKEQVNSVLQTRSRNKSRKRKEKHMSCILFQTEHFHFLVLWPDSSFPPARHIIQWTNPNSAGGPNLSVPLYQEIKWWVELFILPVVARGKQPLWNRAQTVFQFQIMIKDVFVSASCVEMLIFIKSVTLLRELLS